jgi:hypothetical protein
LKAAVFVAACVFLLLPHHAQAQIRGVRRVPARPVVVRGAFYRPLFYDPFFYSPFYDPWYFPFGWYPGFAAAGQFYANNDSSLRLDVSPRETEVFIDGSYAGTVDDFDGFFQRLHLGSGEHTLELYLQGYRSVRQQIYLQPRGTFRVRHTMERLGAGEAQEPRPGTQAQPPQAQLPQGAPPPRQRPFPSPQGRPGFPDFPRGSESAGTIALRVQPGDADVLIDGERWQGPEPNEQLVLQVASGRHRIEVRRDGYRTYTSEVNVRAGDTTTLNISLSRQ